MEEKPKLTITLYLPDGDYETYVDCELGASLVPELEFKGRRRLVAFIEGRHLISDAKAYTHITSTTLPYKIEALTDVIN
jgi:hypothetical protein